MSLWLSRRIITGLQKSSVENRGDPCAARFADLSQRTLQTTGIDGRFPLLRVTRIA
jgi:hypothetical protein